MPGGGPTDSSGWTADSEYRRSTIDASLNPEPLYTQGHTGAGQTIAVLDAGFRRSHREIQGKITGVYGAPGVSAHGTHVAAIAAGARDGQGMMGVAYGANLHLASINRPGGATPRHWAGATRAAARAGAVAQNNSWRFDREVTLAEARAALAETGSVDAALARLTRTGRTYAPSSAGEAAWRDFLTALRGFQRTGVIVKSLSNDLSGDLRQAKAANLHAALPSFDPRLAGAWLTVANVTRSGGTARLHSAPCAEAAAYCLAVDGNGVLSASATSDSSYQRLSGTSMAAPQVSGAVAVLAEAFPGISPRELAARLLATADNSYFAHDGRTRFSGGVSHGYSNQYGHGSPDLAAALKPVGGVGVALEGQASGPRAALSESGLSGGPAAGDALAQALEGRRLVVFDALGAPFAIEAAAIASAPVPARREMAARLSLLGAYGGKAMLVDDGAGQITAFQQTRAPGDYVFLRQGRFGFDAAQAPSLADAMAFAVVTPDFSAAYGETNRAAAVRASYDLGGGLSLGARGFTADLLGGGALHGAGADIALRRGPLTLSLGMDGGREVGGVGGLSGRGAYTLGRGDRVMARLAGEWRLNDTLALYGAYAWSAAGGEGRLAGVSGRLDAFTVGLRGEDLLRSGDRWSLSLSQPMRFTGALRLNLAEGRALDGAVLGGSRRFSLAPSGRELALSLGYETPTGPHSRLALSAGWRRDAGHVRGAQGFEAMAVWRLEF